MLRLLFHHTFIHRLGHEFHIGRRLWTSHTISPLGKWGAALLGLAGAVALVLLELPVEAIFAVILPGLGLVIDAASDLVQIVLLTYILGSIILRVRYGANQVILQTPPKLPEQH